MPPLADLPDDPASPHVPARWVIASAAALWLCYYVLVTLRGAVLGLDHQGELAMLRLLVVIAGIAITLMAWPVLRAVAERRLVTRVVVALVVMVLPALLIAAVNDHVFHELNERLSREMQDKMSREQGVRIREDESGNLLVEVPALPSPPPPRPTGGGAAAPPEPAGKLVTIARKEKEPRWLQLTDVALGRYFLLIAWAALYFALGYAEHARAAERREGEFRRAAKAAELRSLRYQVNPHFLFNTLNSLSALVLTGKTQAAETMIQTISTFYRRSLAGDPTADVALAEEIRLQQLYLEIEAVRFPERLQTRFDIPPELENACVPGMLLQPLVENSVKYAVATTARPVTIGFAAREEHGRLVLTVGDDGPGALAPSAAANGLGVGLRNVRDRLAARFGADASVVSGSTGEGYATIIRLPLLRHGC